MHSALDSTTISSPVVQDRTAKAIGWTKQLLQGTRHYSGVLSIVLLISLGSKVLGLVREVYISSRFGVSEITDSFFGVQQLPVMMMSYMTGAFTLAFVPHYVVVKAHGRHRQFLRRLLLVLAAITAVATFAMIIGASDVIPSIVGVRSQSHLVQQFSRVLSGAVLPSAIIGLAFSIFHAEREHGKAMLLSTMAPAVMLISLLGWNHLPGASFEYALPWSYVIGTALAAVWAAKRVIIALRIAETPDGTSTGPPPTGLKFVQQLSAASVENVAFSLNQLLTVHYAALTGAGAIALNAYALRIAMLPLSGAATPLNQIVSTWLAKQEFTNRKRAFARALLLAGAAYTLCAVAMFFSRHPIVRLVYQRGAFSATDTAYVVQVLSPYALYFLVMALNQLFARFYFVAAKGHVYTGVLLAGYLIANCLKPFGAIHFQLLGVIYAAVIGEGIALVILALLFLRHKARSSA